MLESNNEKIEINNKILQCGVLSDDKGYQLYLYPGMTVAELAFNVNVIIHLLLQEGHIKSKDEFINLVDKYHNDPQYAPLGGENNG